MVQELNSLSAYEAELQKPGVVVIDFYSPQCGPCAVRTYIVLNNYALFPGFIFADLFLRY